MAHPLFDDDTQDQDHEQPPTRLTLHSPQPTRISIQRRPGAHTRARIVTTTETAPDEDEAET